MKAAPVIRALDDLGIAQRLVHTGQHYSDSLSEVFFRELELPRPDVNLGVGSGSHAAQTGTAMVALEEHFLASPPALMLLYGDVNSTLAAALVAAKNGLRSAHVEAGLRSFDRSMPEEINRLVTDALADLLFTTSPEALENLKREGVNPTRVHFVGNPMIDTLLRYRDRFDPERQRSRFDLPVTFGVVTIHRAGNVDSPVAARRVACAMLEVAERIPLIIPMHPRGRERLASAGLVPNQHLRIVDPLGYMDFVSLVSGARLVITDSGGIQEETTILGVPCLTLRPNTERPITITNGTNRLVEPEVLGGAVDAVMAAPMPLKVAAPPLWDGHAGSRIAAVIAEELAMISA
jgi:UDP-N-acetylglucosamine 2-epimerase (non-hydrolysing)